MTATTPGMGAPVGAQPPPPLPQDPTISNMLSNYLTQFSLWCRRGFAAKMNVNAPVAGIMFQAWDAPAGTTPTIWLLRVSSNGAFIPVQIPPGGANASPSVMAEPPP